MRADKSLDCIGLYCPMPIVKTAEKFKEMKLGEILEMVADDKGIKLDMPAWCKTTGHDWVGMEEEGEEIGRMGMIGMVAFSLLFAIGLFFLLPVIASKPLEGILGSDIASNLAEGIIRLVIFLVYIYLIGRLKQIDRVFMYHGAEHMTVHAQEHMDPLKVENIRKYPTAHPRCGTAFLLIVMVLAVVAFTFVGRDPFWWLLASRIVLIPVIAAVSYEIIRFSGFHTNNIIVKLIIAPSLALQMLTTRQPDDDQIEIAIAAMNQALEIDGNAATQSNE